MSNHLNAYFSRAEFACNCRQCGRDVVDTELLDVLMDLRTHFRAPVYINSGNRCVEYNEAVGGASKSQHLLGKAADIVVSGLIPDEVYGYLDKKYPNTYGIGLYQTFVHIDVREHKARWKLQSS